MTWLQLAYVHLATVFPCLLIGGWLLARPKGTPVHRALGRIYVVLMITTALVTLAMPAQVGPQLLGHLGYVHLFSVLVLVSIPLAVRGARRGSIRTHRGHMLGVYFGGILVAGGFTLMPGRLLHGWLFG